MQHSSSPRKKKLCRSQSGASVSVPQCGQVHLAAAGVSLHIGNNGGRHCVGRKTSPLSTPLLYVGQGLNVMGSFLVRTPSFHQISWKPIQYFLLEIDTQQKTMKAKSTFSRLFPTGYDLQLQTKYVPRLLFLMNN